MIISNTTQGSVPYINASNGLAFLAPSSTNAYVLAYNTSTNVPYWKADANTNNKTAQNISTTNDTYPILLGHTANATKNIGNQATLFGSGIKANPSTSTISCSNIETTTINGNTPITSGNISSQSVNYANSAGNLGSYVKPTSGGSLSIFPTGGSYRDGIRIHARTSDNSWAAVLLCGADNTGDSGTSANSWFIGANSGNFYIGRGGTGGRGTYLRCVDNVWTWNGTASANVSYASSAGSVSWSNVTSGSNANGSFTITGGSGRANLNLISATNVPNDLYFGSSGYQHWSLTSRENSDPWFGLYNARTGAWGFQISVSNCNVTFGAAVYSNSDRHLKKNISSIPTSSLERLFDISDKLLKKFTWKQTGEDTYGFIAQELEQYIPEAVSENKRNVKTVSYDVAYAKIIAALVQKVKELEDIIKNGRN